MANPWLSHVKQTMKANRGVAFKQVLLLAKKSYKSSNRLSKKNLKYKKGSRRFRHRGGSGGLGKLDVAGNTGVAAGASEVSN